MSDPPEQTTGPVVAVAGRRIDADGAPVRFPLANARAVAERIRAFLATHGASALVASAACGSDILALEQAAALDLDRRAVLPFARDRFRATSVTDRPGDWGPRFDRVLRDLGDRVHILPGVDGEDDAAYARVNEALLDEAAILASAAADHPPARPILALLVWEGAPRGAGDLTANFRDRARERGIPVAEIQTL